MVLSDVSIKRPVFAAVVSAVLVLFGIFAYQKLPVREYPDIDEPIISISTVYTGASAEVIETQVTQIIEEAVSGIEGVKRLTSSSREQSSGVNIEFNLDRDIDTAANDVRDNIARSINRLPDAADPPRIAKTDSDSRPILYMRLFSDRHDALQLSDYATRYLVDSFSTVPGVALARIYGERRFAMRIWLYRQQLAARGVTVQDVEGAIRRQNVELPSGRLESRQRELSVRTASSLSSPEQFRNIVVKQAADGYLVRLGEIARVEVAPENVRSEFRNNGQVTIGIGITKQSKANTLEVAEGTKKIVASLSESLPPGMSLIISYDSSIFIRSSIDEVMVALGISLVLVVGVIFIFLRTFRATLIPAIAIPVSIIASFTVIAAFGFSINVLTLLALVLAIGLVVDDAIVVVENVHRHIEEGMPPLLAALQGSRQIGFAIIATTLTLTAVFVPISFLEGSTGRLFREFGIAVAVSVLFSGLVALTLTPMMCSKLIKPSKDEGLLYRLTQPMFDGLNRGYGWLLGAAMRAPIIVIAVAAAISAGAVQIYAQLPQEFSPIEDRGSIMIPVTTPEGSSFDYTKTQVMDIEKRLKPIVDRGDAENVQAIVAPGFGRPGAVNSAFVILQLKPYEQRHTSQMAIQRELFPQLAALPGVRAFPLNPPSLGQRAGASPVQFIVSGPSYPVIEEWTERILVKARQNRNLLNLDTDYDLTQPELRVVIDRDRAADQGVLIDDIGRTLETLLGSRKVTTYEDRGKQYEVMLQARATDREVPNDISNIFVRSAKTNSMIPLTNLVRFDEGATAREFNRTDRLRSITITAALAPDYPLANALKFLDDIASEELPAEARVSYGGESRTFKEASAAILFTFAMALLIVFLVLAAQFESFVHPAIIMLSVPLAITGALAAMAFSGLSINIYTQIGMIMLVGLVAKNGILIVEFANQLRDEGRSVAEAVHEASVIRLRPILMTTIATALGAVPLAMAHGAGAESRQSLGIVVIGGITFATVLSLFLIPVMYMLFARFTKPAGSIARRLSAMETDHEIKHREKELRQSSPSPAE